MSNQGNIKNVMRTALVGVKPADQVMLKGYLRVLLRLEADLEWVSANHPQVDLFMINEDFRSSSNIIKLLQTQSEKPVLYISRNTFNHGGEITSDLLSLPLKDMHVLNDWLFKKVHVLKNQSGDSQRRSSADRSLSQQPTSIQAQNSVTHQPNNNTIKTVSETKDSSSQKSNFFSSENSSTHNNENSLNNLIEVIQKLQKGVSGAYQLMANDKVIAIIEPNRCRLWKDANSENTVMQTGLINWRLEPTSAPPSADKDAIDMKQWLWDVSSTKTNEILPLIDEQRTYRIHHWIKPNHNDDRRDLLRIMTAMESIASTVEQISENAGTSPIYTKKVIAGMLLSGFLQPESYENITIVESSNNSIATHNNQEPKAQQTISTLDSVLSKRAAGIGPSEQPSSTIPSSITSQPSNQQTKQKTEQQEKKPAKMGFLSRLRRKLGL